MVKLGDRHELFAIVRSYLKAGLWTADSELLDAVNCEAFAANAVQALFL
jgi:hypothetical protein